MLPKTGYQVGVAYSPKVKGSGRHLGAIGVHIGKNEWGSHSCNDIAHNCVRGQNSMVQRVVYFRDEVALVSWFLQPLLERAPCMHPIPELCRVAM